VAIAAADPVGGFGNPSAAIAGAARGATAATVRPLRTDRRSDEIVLIRCILAPAYCGANRATVDDVETTAP
jgi:hypothetical protein